MPELAVDKAVGRTGETLEEMAQSASRLKSSVSQTLEGNLYRVRRAAKRSWHGTQDLIDNAAHEVKRHPFEALAIAAGAGIAIGLVIGLVVRRD